MRRRLIRTGLLTAIVGSVLAFAVAGPSFASATKVGISGKSISSYKFKPATVHVTEGKTVKWSWNSNASHNVTFKKLGKHSKTAKKATYALDFAKKGTYRYVCTIHGFKGKVVVR